MPFKYPSAVRSFVLRLLNVKLQPIQLIIEFTGISKKSITRWDRCGVLDKKPVFQGVTKSKEAWLVIRTLLDKKADWTHKSLRDELLDKQISCSLRTIFNILKNNQISRKRIKKKKCSKNATVEAKSGPAWGCGRNTSGARTHRCHHIQVVWRRRVTTEEGDDASEKPSASPPASVSLAHCCPR